MINSREKTRLSPILAGVLIITILFSSIAYGREPQKTFENLGERIEYLELMIRYIKAKYKYDVTDEQLMEGAYKGLFEALDQHSKYFTPDNYDNFNLDTSGTFGGIGISVGMRNGNVTVIAPLKGTPGDRAGIKAGDIIKIVDDIDISEYNLEKVLKLMRGEPDTDVRLGILRKGSTQIKYFDIVRDIIKINPVEYEVIDDNIGYIKIIQFNKNTNEYIKKALDDLLDKNVKSFIVDLRNNPGGALSEVVKVADYFVPKGLPIVHIQYRKDKRDTRKSKLEDIDKPLVVLVDGGSASASEIFAGAIQDAKSGIVIGTQTYGKGTIQNVLSLSNGGGLKITIGEYLTPKERKIDGVGLTPDLVIENIAHENRDDIKTFVPMIEDVKPQKKDKGLNVYGAQQRLGYIGYDVEVTGILDDKTHDAIKEFQKSQGLSPYGVLDYTTRDKLYERAIEVYNEGIKDLQLEKAIQKVSSF